MCFSEISANFGFLKFDNPDKDGTNDRLSQVNCLDFCASVRGVRDQPYN